MAQLPFAVLPLEIGTVTTGNETAELPASNLGLFKHIGMTWKTTGSGNAWVRGNFASAQIVDFVSMLKANAGSGTTIRVRLGSSQEAVDGNSATYDSAALPFVAPAVTRDDGLYNSHLQLTTPITASWWRIDIGGHSGDFEGAKLVMGKRLTPAHYYNSDFQFGPEDLGDLDLGRWGVPQEASGLIFRRLKFTLGWLSKVEFETMFRPMVEKLGKRGVLYWCHDPEATVYRQAQSYLGWLRDPPMAQGGVKPGNYSQDYHILSMI